MKQDFNNNLANTETEVNPKGGKQNKEEINKVKALVESMDKFFQLMQ